MKPKKTTDSIKFHPAAKAFPLMVEYSGGRLLNVEENETWKRFVQDIRIHGQREPITLVDGKILDGRNRYLACQALGIPVLYVEQEGDVDALSLSLNLHRRHLTAGQVAAVVVEQILPQERKAAKARQGKRDTSPSAGGEVGATERAAKRGGVGKASVERYEALPPESQAEVKKGKASVSGAYSAMKREERDAAEKKDKVAKATRLGRALADTLNRAARAAADVSSAGKAIDHLPDHISQEIVEAYAKLRGEITSLPFKEQKNG